MPVNKAKIISEMKSFMTRNGISYSEWHVGVTDDPLEVFDSQLVDINQDRWLCTEAFTLEEARQVQEHFIEQLGSKGDRTLSVTGRFIFAYRKGGNE